VDANQLVMKANDPSMAVNNTPEHLEYQEISPRTPIQRQSRFMLNSKLQASLQFLQQQQKGNSLSQTPREGEGALT